MREQYTGEQQYSLIVGQIEERIREFYTNALKRGKDLIETKMRNDIKPEIFRKTEELAL